MGDVAQFMILVWLLPSLAVALALRWMIHSDDMRVRDMQPFAIGMFLMFTVFWPLGFAFLVYILFHAMRDK